MSSKCYTISGFPRRRKSSSPLFGTCRKAALHPARTSLPDAGSFENRQTKPHTEARPLPRRTLGQMLIRKAGVPFRGGDA